MDHGATWGKKLLAVISRAHATRDLARPCF